MDEKLDNVTEDIMRESRNSLGEAIGEDFKAFCIILSIIFCALRATGVVQWGWVVILSPIITLLLISLFATIVMIAYIVNVEAKIRNHKNKK